MTIHTAVVPVVHVECHRVPAPVALLEEVVGDTVAVLLEAAEGPHVVGGGVDEEDAVRVARHDGAEALHDVDAAPLEVEQVGEDGQASQEQPASRGWIGVELLTIIFRAKSLGFIQLAEVALTLLSSNAIKES